MLLIPAIGVQDGRCVAFANEAPATPGGDAVALTRRWVEAGARRLHVRDNDSLQSGRAENSAPIAALCAAYPDVPLQVEGGVRDEETVQAYLDAGAQYVIIGTKAASAPHFVRDLCLEFPGHILLDLVAKDGKMAADGWSKLQNQDAAALAAHFERDGVEGFVYTDLTDGNGINLTATAALARALTVPVLAGELPDIKAMRALAAAGVAGALLGRLLYDKKFDFSAAQAQADAASAKSDRD